MTKNNDVLDDNDNGFPEKLLKFLPPGFSDEADTMSEADLKKCIVSCENNICVSEKEKEEDVKLNAARELSKDLGLKYREMKSCQNAKIKYCIHLLNNTGVDLDK